MTLVVYDNISFTELMIVIDIDNSYISLSVAGCIVAYGKMPIYIGIANNMDIAILLKILSRLLVYYLNIVRSIHCRLNHHVRMGICWNRNAMGRDFRIDLLGKVVFLIGCHSIPFLSSISIVDAPMPNENTARTNLGTSSSKGFAKRQVVVHLGNRECCSRSIGSLLLCSFFRLFFSCNVFRFRRSNCLSCIHQTSTH